MAGRKRLMLPGAVAKPPTPRSVAAQPAVTATFSPQESGYTSTVGPDGGPLGRPWERSYEGANNASAETARWMPSFRSPDAALNGLKRMADARGVDMTTNEGNARGAVQTYKNSIVGEQYRLNAQPNWRVLAQSTGTVAFDDVWADEFQVAVESWFNLIAESDDCWLDASGRMTFTAMVRMQVGSHIMRGEGLTTVEWLRTAGRPFNTALQMISPDRLSNPNNMMDDFYNRRGIVSDDNGMPVSYNILDSHPGAPYANGPNKFTWTNVLARKPWGRRQVIHIVDNDQSDQSRGVAEMVSVLKSMKMVKHFAETTLQNAVINASYAASIESELPTEAVAAALGRVDRVPDGNGEAFPGMEGLYGQYMGILNKYLEGANGIKLDGAMIPHLFPGTKLNARALGTPGGVGTDFEVSLHRHISAGLGLSYEEYSRDFSKTNYSSGMLAMNVSDRSKRAKKKFIADRWANEVYSLILEELVNDGYFPMPTKWQPANSGIFYETYAKDALTSCQWVGAGRGQVDQLKETQAAVMRIASGLSTHELEIARLGYDWRDIYAQQKRENTLEKQLGLLLSTDASKSSGPTSTAQIQDPPDNPANAAGDA